MRDRNLALIILLLNLNMSGSLGEREILWEHEPRASVSTAFSSSPKLLQPESKITYRIESE